MTAVRETLRLYACGYAEPTPERGACARVAGRPVARFRTDDGAVHALCDHGPSSGASVLSCGIVGTRGQAPAVASPMDTQVFDVWTGRCRDDPRCAVAVSAVRVRSGRAEGGVR